MIRARQWAIAALYALACIPALAQFTPGPGQYALVAQYNGTVPASTDVLRFVAPQVFKCPAGIPDTQAESLIAATANTVFTISKNSVSIGSIQFDAGGTGITLTFASAVTFVPGDLLQITSPAVADATLADITITLVCSRMT